MTTPSALYQRLQRARAAERPQDELALIDVREPGEFKQGHLLLASNAPLSRLEWLAPLLLPRRDVPIVVCAEDGADPRVLWAQRALQGWGYQAVHTLDGTLADCERAGFVLFTGFNVPSKAFGEWLEQQRETPQIAPDELATQRSSANPPLIFDCRPIDEHQQGTLPDAIHAPGVELASRVAEHITNADQAIVVHCAGRTRGIIAAQSLIDLGLPNPIATLRNGLMGWEMAGQKVETPSAAAEGHPGRPREAGPIRGRSPQAIALAQRTGAQPCTPDDATLPRGRTVYGFTVGTAEEAQTYTPPGFRHVPGGQLLQSLDDHAAVQGSRLIIHAHDPQRAALVAAYLAEMGWHDVRWFAAASTDSADVEPAVSQGPTIRHAEPDAEHWLDPATLELDEATWTLDLGSSRRYREYHLPGAHFAVRGLLPELFPAISIPPGTSRVLLTCTEGHLSAAAHEEINALTKLPVYVLAGGVNAWRAAGRPLDQKPHWLCPPVDTATTPYDASPAEREKHMRDYITWELALLEQIGQDGILMFGESGKH